MDHIAAIIPRVFQAIDLGPICSVAGVEKLRMCLDAQTLGRQRKPRRRRRAQRGTVPHVGELLLQQNLPLV